MRFLQDCGAWMNRIRPVPHPSCNLSYLLVTLPLKSGEMLIIASGAAATASVLARCPGAEKTALLLKPESS